MLIDTPTYSPAMRRRRQAILALFLALAVLYALATPVWEASDEPQHFGVAEHIARTGELPVQRPGVPTSWRQEGSQPPLYYLLVAGLIAPLDFESPAVEPNPHAKIGIGLATDNQNMTLHNPAREAFPWRGAVLATMLGRAFSILLAGGTVWLSFTVAWLAMPQRPSVALMAMGLTAFNPMFLFISASLNNDNLVICLGTLMLAILLSLWRSGWDWLRIGGLALLLGLAALTKLSGLTFAPTIGLVLLLIWWREKRPWPDLLKAAVLCAGSILLIAGWWYVRNLDLYGDITGLNAMVEIAGPRPAGFGLTDVWAERSSFFFAFWGWFGGLNVISPSLFFWMVGLISGLGALGFLLYWGLHLRQTGSRLAPAGILLLQWLIILGGVIRWTMQTPGSQGRLLFPAIVASSFMLALGWWQLAQLVKLSPLWSRWSLVGLGLAAAILPFYTIMPAYAPPTPLTRLPETAQQVDVRYGPIVLRGYEINERPIRVAPGRPGQLTITLYWEPQTRTDQPLSLFVQIFGPPPGPDVEPVLVGKLDSYPSRGLRRTDTWQPGLIYPETYHIPLNEEAVRLAPFEPRLSIGWRDNTTGTTIPAMTIDGQTLATVIVRGGVIWQPCQAAPNDLQVDWSGLAQLRRVELPNGPVVPGNAFTVRAVWQVTDTTPDTYTTFVQVVDPTEPARIRGSGDAAPRQDWYPTHRWVQDTCFEDTYQVYVPPNTPAGTYSLLMGYYIPDSGRRIPLSSGATNPHNDAYQITERIEVGFD